jgi:hypothetical protein
MEVVIDLKIVSVEPETRHFMLEAPDGFTIQVLDPLPARFKAGDTLAIEDDLWRQWKEYWATGPSPDMSLEWFEMADLKKHRLENKVWIPVYAQQIVSEEGQAGFVGFREEYFGAHSLIVPRSQKASALALEWMDLSRGSGDTPWFDQNGILHSASDYESDELQGVHPVLVQGFEIQRASELHVNEDIVLGLGLRRDGDIWIRPEDDNVEVIRLIRDRDSKPIRLEIKAEFLKDYLCAAEAGLVLLTYQSRKAIGLRFEKFEKDSDEAESESSSYEWEGAIREVFEGNSMLDILGQARVFHAWRTDTDYDEDIPVYEFPGETDSKSYDVQSASRQVNQASGQIWKKEWIEPAAISPRVRRDKTASRVEFIVDNAGKRETSDTLIGPSRWLWFHPNVINDLLKKPYAALNWYTEDTGQVGGAWNRSVHFGVNSTGLINVYAKDIALLGEIDKRTWANHNVSPEGKVSAELLMSQMQAHPADTESPEAAFFRLSDELQDVSRTKFGREVLRHHASSKEISKKIHRFEATTLDGFYSLCKEITRFLIERIDIDLLKQVRAESETKLGSLKRLERILTALGYDGRKLLSVWAGVYDLRLADAHLPSSADIENAMSLVGIKYDDLRLNAGKHLLQNVNNATAQILEALRNGDFTKL